jgi:phage terminase small subunit
MTPKQCRFVEEYLIDLNAAHAARRAGYSERSAAQQGYNLLRDKTVAAAIAKEQAARATRTGVTADRVIIELAKVAFGDPRRLLSWGPEGVTLRASDELTAAEAALVSEVSETRTSTGGTRRVKLYCKLTALTALGRHLGLFASGANPDSGGDNDDQSADTGDARERLARRIAGLAARLRPDETAQ